MRILTVLSLLAAWKSIASVISRIVDLPDQSLNNATLWRRVMKLPPSNAANVMKDYIMDETGPDSSAYDTVWRVGPADDPSDVNTSVYSELKSERSFVATMLQGCTVLAIISRKGVYIGHYWENIAFATDNDFLLKYETQKKAFEETVLKGLRDGIKDEWEPQEMVQESLTEFASKYADDHIYAYLIRPRIAYNQDYPGEQDDVEKIDGYPKEWQDMKDLVLKLIPKLEDPDRWKTRIYDATDDKKTLKEDTNGRVLFKFDPEHRLPTDRRGKPTRLTKLWLERREIHSDEWTD
ncbi:hypothetical protein BKA63DRAFT_538387 [Paraphoma chrysanthemicola]|nr:hypothetical protein BKA63DRAFT_538387 [Paraphoma chrysanthemicola]